MMLKNQIQNCVGVVFSIAAMVFSNYGLAAEQSENGAIEISDNTFDCMRDMTKVDGFYVDNLLGDSAATIAVASSADGGVYPPGSVVQLVPGEVMVKHGSGFSPATKDWEFFELDVSEEGRLSGSAVLLTWSIGLVVTVLVVIFRRNRSGTWCVKPGTVVTLFL